MKLIRCHLRGLPWEVTVDQLNEWLQCDESFFGVTQKITRKGQYDRFRNNKASAFVFCREGDVRSNVVAKGSMPLLLDGGKLRCVLSIAVGLGTSSGLYDYAQSDEAQPSHYEALENWLQKTGQQAAASAPSFASASASTPVLPEEASTPVLPEEADQVEEEEEPEAPVDATSSPDTLVPRGSLAQMYLKRQRTAPGLKGN